MQKSTGRALIFRSIVATIRFLPEDGTSDTSIPEQCRPLLKYNKLFVNLFRSIVGHSFVESHTFALEITGKGYGRKHN